jgi:hypothetical protein
LNSVYREIFRDKAIAERVRGKLLSLVDKEPSSALASMKEDLISELDEQSPHNYSLDDKRIS